MEATIPAAIEVQAALKALSHAQMQELARLADVPFTTLWKVRSGETGNPGIETVRKFTPHIDTARLIGTDGAAPPPASADSPAQEAA